MADYIDSKKLMDDISKYSIENYAGLIRNVVMKQPVVDVVEVVRCKDCQFYEEVEYYPDCGIKCVCRLFKRQMHNNDFCSYGVRKNDG